MEHMKPLIREWMDENFPSLLENAVRTEVARAVKARGRR
jgi:cell pole-organizing protein PopZ